MIRYGIVSLTATYWNPYIARWQGLYAAEGLEVDFIITGGTAETIEQLVAGRIDLAGCSPDELLSAVQRGADLVVVGGIINRPVSTIVGQPSIQTLAELRGRRIGVNQTHGSVSMVFRAALRRAGLETTDYEQVRVGSTPAMAAALRQGRVDAAMLTAPFDLELLAEGFTALANVGDLFPRYAFTTINARRQWVNRHRSELAAFFRATRRAGDLIADPRHRTTALETLGQATGLRGQVLERTYVSYTVPGVLALHGEVDRECLDMLLEQMRQEGLLSATPPRLDDVLLPCWPAGRG